MDLDRLTALENKWRSERGDQRLKREFWTARDHIAWQDIFRQYVALAGAGHLEALKRALYMAWAKYSQSFPLTGLEILDETVIRDLMTIADVWVRTGRLDTELAWMLSYYYLVDDCYLENFDGFEELKGISRQDSQRYRTECQKVPFENRGLLGEYWTAKQRYLRSRQVSQGSSAAAPTATFGPAQVTQPIVAA